MKLNVNSENLNERNELPPDYNKPRLDWCKNNAVLNTNRRAALELRQEVFGTRAIGPQELAGGRQRPNI
ncbi:unnamed protein product, partial [Nesidiocoris tenuis]